MAFQMEKELEGAEPSARDQTFPVDVSLCKMQMERKNFAQTVVVIEHDKEIGGLDRG